MIDYKQTLLQALSSFDESPDLVQILLAISLHATADINADDFVSLVSQALYSLSNILGLQAASKQHVQSFILPQDVRYIAHVQLLTCASSS